MPTSDVEELLAERGLDVSYETVRLWVLKFGPVASAFFDGVRRSEPRALGIDQQTGQHARFGCFSFALMVAGIASELAANSGPRSHPRSALDAGRGRADPCAQSDRCKSGSNVR